MNRDQIVVLLSELRERVEHEDYIGTCGSREEAAELEADHRAVLGRIDSAIRALIKA